MSSQSTCGRSPIQVRLFARSDRDQVTHLVNRHISAVVPGVSVSVSALLSRLEREPDQYIVDPWVTERVTLVAEQRQRVVAAAHLLRYADDGRVSEHYRDAAEIRWLVSLTEGPYRQDAGPAAEALILACLNQLRKWSPSQCYADGTLPAPGVYGVPEQWPHIRNLYEKAGFQHTGDTEIILLARIADLPDAGRPPIDGLTVQRTPGICGTRISAVLDRRPIGYIEVDSLDAGPRSVHAPGLADIGNLYVEPEFRRRGLATWLIAQAGAWLALGDTARLMAYAAPDETAELSLLTATGFHELTRTIRNLTLTGSSTPV